jgi:hypothetical protein
MILENATLRAEWGALPFPERILYKPTGLEIDCARSDGTVLMDGAIVALCEGTSEWTGSTCRFVAPDGRALAFYYRIEPDALLLSVRQSPDSAGPVGRIDFEGAPLLHFGPGFRFARDLFRQRSWNREAGPGLLDGTIQIGLPLEEIPDAAPEGAVHACAFDGTTCVYLQSSERYLPLSTRILLHPDFPNRGGGFSLAFHHATLSISGCGIPPLEMGVRFCRDLNGDGQADECEYQLDLKKHLPAAHPLYLDTFWYKIWSGCRGQVDTDYAQSMELIERIDRMTGGERQVVYLTGYQGEGHDSEYPAYHRLNLGLGSREALLELISTAKERFGAVIGVHVNVDDAYREHTDWDPSIIGTHPDGSMMRWESFNGKWAYHINHRRDVLSGKVFQRLDALLDDIPLRDSIHLDAFRNMNSSWGVDGYIGPQEELYGGMIPILDHLRKRGIEVSTESQNGMAIELIGLFTGVYHNVGFWPILAHGRLFGGGQGGHPVALVKGSGVDDDLSARHLGADAEEMLDWIAERHLLYRFFLQREMVEYRGALECYDGRYAYARYDDGTTARGQRLPPVLEVLQGEVLVADLDTRFLPIGRRLFVWHRRGGRIERALPTEFIGCGLTAVLTDAWGRCTSDGFTMVLDGGRILLDLPAHTLLRIEVQ